MLPQQLDSLNLSGTSRSQMMSRFIEVFKQMWVANGDHLSRIYAGTGALGSGRSKVEMLNSVYCTSNDCLLIADDPMFWLDRSRLYR